MVKRFGAALNLNVHVHALVLDGVFTRDGSAGCTFHQAAPIGDDEVESVLRPIRGRVVPLLDRHGHRTVAGPAGQVVGGPDAPRLRVRRARLPPVRLGHAPDRAHRAGGCRHAHPPPPRRGHGGPRSGPRPSAAVVGYPHGLVRPAGPVG